MSDPPKRDANDVIREGGELEVTGTPIDPGAVVVSMDSFRKRSRASSPRSGGGAPPADDVPHPADGGGDDDDDERPKIVVSTEEGEVNAAAVRALARLDHVYVRGNALMRVLPGRRTDPPTIDLIPKEMLQEHLAVAARFVKLQPSKEKGKDWDEIRQHPPRWCVGAVHTRGLWPELPDLLGVVEVPVLRRDGSILSEPGYDKDSALYLAPRDRLLVPPTEPTADDVKAALEELAEVVCDVFWAHPAHRSTWLASALTPLARAAFDGPAPLFLFEAPTAGTGKGLLVSCAVRIATGRAVAFATYTADDDEMGKQIVAWGSSGRSVVVLDEVTGRLDGAKIRSALTGDVIEGRLLGLSKSWSGPNRITWYATGNNVQKGKEMFRRIAPVQILSPVEDPSRRAGFKHADLKAHVAARQPELTRAALTILRAYVAAGRPDMKLPPWGSFEGWSGIVRAAIVWAGWEDPAAGAIALQDEDTRQTSYRSLAEQWVKLVSLNNGHSLSAKDALRFVNGDPAPLPQLKAVLEEIASDKDGKPSARSLGYVLRALKHAVFGTNLGAVRFESKLDRNGTTLWTAVVVAGDRGDAGDGFPAPDHSSASPNSPGGNPSPASPSSPAEDLFSRAEKREEKKDPRDEWGGFDDEPR